MYRDKYVKVNLLVVSVLCRLMAEYWSQNNLARLTNIAQETKRDLISSAVSILNTNKVFVCSRVRVFQKYH